MPEQELVMEQELVPVMEMVMVLEEHKLVFV